MTTPKVLADMRGVLLAEPPRGHPLQAVHELGELDGRGEVNEEVDMVVFSVQFGKLAAEVRTDLCHHFPAAVKHRGGESTSAVLCHEHQVSVASRYRMPARTNGCRCGHNPNMVTC